MRFRKAIDAGTLLPQPDARRANLQAGHGYAFCAVAFCGKACRIAPHSGRNWPFLANPEDRLTYFAENCDWALTCAAAAGTRQRDSCSAIVKLAEAGRARAGCRVKGCAAAK